MLALCVCVGGGGREMFVTAVLLSSSIVHFNAQTKVHIALVNHYLAF